MEYTQEHQETQFINVDDYPTDEAMEAWADLKRKNEDGCTRFEE